MKITNPATEEVITTIPEDTDSSLQKKYTQLKQMQPSWYQKHV